MIEAIRSICRIGLYLAPIALGTASAVPGAEFSAEQLEFFEKKVRPIFVEHCHECHGDGEREGGLSLTSRAQLLTGGDTGPAVRPGDAQGSELILAVSYDPAGYQMPPSGKLPDELIATLREWVEMGAPWPTEAPAAEESVDEFNLAERAERWSFQPLASVRPPEVRDHGWPRTGIDRFLLQKLEEAGLRPADETDRRTWLRRAYLDTIGLPPTPEEINSFVSDSSPDAHERVVDRLLSSPHFGERWGRHWLDLVRYAESRGHEFDYDVANPWHYRDYVIGALNDDVPYDRFAVEHVAGDLLRSDAPGVQPVGLTTDERYGTRFDPLTGANESIVGTGFWFFGEWVHSPVDIRQEEAERFENMIDVYSKTFLGLTVACARCHDHKFDPIPQQDYYALQGYLQSSAYRQARFETLDQNRRIAGQLEELEQEAAREILPLLLELAEIPADAAGVPAAAGGLDSAIRFADGTEVIADYTRNETPFLTDGMAFGLRPVRAGDVELGDDPGRPIVRVATSDFVERDPLWNRMDLSAGTRDEPARLEGWRRAGRTLRTPTFEIRQPRVYALLEGGCNAYVAVDSHITVNGPLHGSLLSEHPAQAGWRWIALDVSRYAGHGAHIEFIARADEPFRIRTVVQSPAAPEGGTQEPVMSPELGRAAWIVANAEACGLTAEPARAQLSSAAAPYIERRRELLSQIAWSSSTAPAMIDSTGADEYVFIRGNWKKPGETVPRRFLEVFGGEPAEGASLHDVGGGGRIDDDTTHVSVETDAERSGMRGSGRLELALQMVDPEQTPIVPRVIVNRVWQHYFGRGLVPTPDDFGYMGTDPTHPELLEWLAGELVEQDWSLKHIHRLILLSAAYRMSSADLADEGDARGDRPDAIDPTNRLLHRMPLKRLEGEIIRDQVLALSGRLDSVMYGPGVPVHLTPFMEGRGRPAVSGPVDGEGRRSLYIAVRRNFPDPFFQAFDFPNPHTTMGRRSVSNVPAQALAMMNNPFIVEQSRTWAERLLRETPGAGIDQRVERLHQSAFCRPPTEQELDEARAFIASQSAEYGAGANDSRSWADYCHVLMNVKEFTFIQ